MLRDMLLLFFCGELLQLGYFVLADPFDRLRERNRSLSLRRTEPVEVSTG
jgi:hypothetical protein